MSETHARELVDSGGGDGTPVYDGFMSYSHGTDQLLAPRLQSGLQRFAKPWWKRRGLRIFRDESSLSANPHLWSSITGALDESSWFVLLLSPGAAESEWVNREVDYWIEHRGADRIIPVVTDGEFSWGVGDVDPGSSAVPPALYGAFVDEPRWVDLRFARTEEQLDLRNPRFRDAVADVASAMRGIPKDELESEEVRQHRRTVRTAWFGAVVVLALAVLAALAALLALDQRNEAEAQRENAVAAAAEADTQRLAAEDAAHAESEQRALAEARALGASAQAALDEDPELSVMLAAAAVEASPATQHLATLHEALQQHRSIAYGEWHPDPRVKAFLGYISPSGRRFAAAGANHVAVWNVDDPTVPLWERELAGEHTYVEETVFTTDDSSVVFIAAWDPEAGPMPDGYRQGLFVLDAVTGEELSFTPMSGCGGIIMPDPRGVDLSGPIVGIRYAATGDGCDLLSGQLGVYDPKTAEFRELTPLQGWDEGVPSSSSDARVVAHGAEGATRVVDTETGEEILAVDGGAVTMLSSDGALLLTGGDPLELWDVSGGESLHTFQGLFTDAGFSADGSRFYAFGTAGTVTVFDTDSGNELLSPRDGRGTVVASFGDDGRRLTTTSPGGTWRAWDIAEQIQGEVARYDAGPTGYRNTGSLSSTGSVVSSKTWDWDATARAWVAIFDAETGRSSRVLDSISEGALSLDGTVVAIQPMLEDVELTEEETGGAAGVYQKIGPIRVVDLEDGTFVEMEGLCEWYNGFWTDNEVPGPDCGDYPEPFMDIAFHLALSPDALLVAMTGPWYTNAVTVWDANSGELLWQSAPLEQQRPQASLAFSPEADQLVVTSATALRVFDARTGEEQITLDRGQRIARPVFAPDGDRLYGAEFFEDRVSVFETATWGELPEIDVGGPIIDLAISRDGSILAASGEGFVTIIDLASGVQHHLAFDARESEGATFVNNLAFSGSQHVMLAVLPPGPVYVMTLDPNELVDIARSRVTRGFTEEECATYALDPCPSLEDIRSG